VPPTTEPATTTAAPTTAPAPAGPSFDTLPDGSPAPIIAIFDFDEITLSGAVPSQETKDRLEQLALVNSKFVVPVDSQLIIDPSVPIGIGVRVVELTSSRFEPGSSAIVGDHIAEFERVVAVMNSLPNVTALVIGHADQIGNQETNYKLSAERAAAVVDFMVARGISPSRLASRAVGDSDLLTLNNDAASLALNRRTEFVLYGLLDS
jgi:outer membrane protein OmpA-like peptidoglycan-associated protein